MTLLRDLTLCKSGLMKEHLNPSGYLVSSLLKVSSPEHSKITLEKYTQ